MPIISELMTWFQQQQLIHRIAAHIGRGEHEEVVRCAELALRDRPRDTTLMSLLSASLDFRFIRFVTGLISHARPDAMESLARDAERRLDRESADRRKHAAKYLSKHAWDHPDA